MGTGNIKWNWNSIKIAPMRIVAIVLFIIAWLNGDVSGILAWILLLLLIDLKFDWNRK
jgi:hypothetical protein